MGPYYCITVEIGLCVQYIDIILYSIITIIWKSLCEHLKQKKSWIWFWSWNYPHKGLIPSIRYSPNCITTIHSSLFGHVYAKMNLHMIFMSVPTNHGITCGILWQDMINLHLILPTHRISKSCLLTRCTHVLHYLLQLHTLWCLINSKINNYVQSKLSMWAWHSKPEHEQEE